MWKNLMELLRQLGREYPAVYDVPASKNICEDPEGAFTDGFTSKSDQWPWWLLLSILISVFAWVSCSALTQPLDPIAYRESRL